jgi:hypothetical protein
MKSGMMRWLQHTARMAKMIHEHTMMVAKPEGTKAFEKPMQRWEDNIKIVTFQVLKAASMTRTVF